MTGPVRRWYSNTRRWKCYFYSTAVISRSQRNYEIQQRNSSYSCIHLLVLFSYSVQVQFGKQKCIVLNACLVIGLWASAHAEWFMWKNPWQRDKLFCGGHGYLFTAAITPFLCIYIYICLRYFPLNHYYYFEGSFLSAKISLHNWFHRPTFCTKDYLCECVTFLYELRSLLFLFTHSGCVPPSAFKEIWHRRQTKHLTWLSNFFPQNLRIYSFWVSFDVSDRAFQGLFFSSCFKVSTGYLRHAVCKLYWQAAVNVSKVNLAWVQIW